MKISSAPGKNNPSPEEFSRGCLTTNLAVPGLGSVIGGRKVGYIQMAVYFTGFALTLIFGIQFINWALAHWSEIHNPPEDDPLAPLRLIWVHARWPLLGILLFVIAWSWAISTSYAMLREAKTGKAAP